jgi:circadian clock protein KaiB
MSETAVIANGLDEGEPIIRAFLFLAGGEVNSVMAQKNVERLLATPDGARMRVESINVFEDYQRALDHGVLVTPCLLVVDPPPRVMIVGTLDDRQRVLAALHLQEGKLSDAR